MNPIEQRIMSVQWDIEFNQSQMKELKEKMEHTVATCDRAIVDFMAGYVRQFNECYEKIRMLDMELEALNRIKEFTESSNFKA